MVICIFRKRLQQYIAVQIIKPTLVRLDIDLCVLLGLQPLCPGRFQ